MLSLNKCICFTNENICEKKNDSWINAVLKLYHWNVGKTMWQHHFENAKLEGSIAKCHCSSQNIKNNILYPMYSWLSPRFIIHVELDGAQLNSLTLLPVWTLPWNRYWFINIFNDICTELVGICVYQTHRPHLHAKCYLDSSWNIDPHTPSMNGLSVHHRSSIVNRSMLSRSSTIDRLCYVS